MKALIVSSTPDAHLMKAVLSARSGIEVTLLEDLEYAEIMRTADLLVIDKDKWSPLLRSQLREGSIVILFSREPLEWTHFEEWRIQGFLHLPFKIETIVSFIKDLLYFFENPNSRRREQRYAVEIPAAIVSGKIEYPVTIIDIGKNGFRAIFNQPMEKNLPDTTTLQIREKDLTASFPNSIRWKHSEGDTLAIGAEWHNFTEEQSQALLAYLALHTGVFKIPS